LLQYSYDISNLKLQAIRYNSRQRSCTQILAIAIIFKVVSYNSRNQRVLTPRAIDLRRLAVGHGSRGGSTWSLGVAPVKMIHQGREHVVDVAHGATHPATVALLSIDHSQEDDSGGQRRTMATAALSVGMWRFQWRWVMGRNEHGGDVAVEHSPTFLPHLEHHHILVLFIVTSLDTMLRHDYQWNQPAMGNSMEAAGVMKSTSMVAALPLSAPRMKKYQCVEVDEHG
jgi:hypothetical protein